MNARKREKLRLAIALGFGLMVTGIALSVVGGARSRDIRFEQKNTRHTFERIDAALANYRAANPRYPQRLSELPLDPSTKRNGWNRAWIYSIEKGKPLVESLGRDGRRGGIGTDADLSNINPRPSQTHVPWWRRVQEDDARMMVVSALFCGFAAGFLVLGALDKVTFAARDMMILVPTLLIALGLAVFGAAVITLLHLPLGH